MTSLFSRGEWIKDRIIPEAYALLPPRMANPLATRFLLAVGWQESRFEHRRQIRGPARGWWQFEQGGGWAGVLSHRHTTEEAHEILRNLRYGVDDFQALADNDILAAAFARLLLWTHPYRLAQSEHEGWAHYAALWRPGRPHPQTWPAAWQWANQLMEEWR